MSGGSYPQPKTIGRKLSGAVNPYSFVKALATGTDDEVVTQTGAGGHAVGICQDGGSDKDAKEIDIYGGGSLLQISASVTRGQWLKSDASGYGTPGTSDGDFCPAMALASGVSGDRIPVLLVPLVITSAE